MAILTTDAHSLSEEFEREIWRNFKVTIIDATEAPWTVQFHGEPAALAMMYAENWCAPRTASTLLEDGSIVEEEEAQHLKAIVVARIKQEVLDDIDLGRLPASVASFSELHDHVDANEYGGFCDDTVMASMYTKLGYSGQENTLIEPVIVFLNSCTAAVDTWLCERSKVPIQ